MSWSPCPDPVPGDRASTDVIETLIVPRAVDLGEMEVRRAPALLKRQMVGPFIFFDQMGPAEFLTDQESMCVPTHINLATVTYALRPDPAPRQSGHRADHRTGCGQLDEGRPRHRSFRAHEPGPQAQRPAPVRHPTWMALPEEQEESDPAFCASRLARAAAGRSRSVTARLIAGQAFGARSPLETPSETLCGRAASPEMRCSRSSHLTRSARSTRLR